MTSRRLISGATSPNTTWSSSAAPIVISPASINAWNDLLGEARAGLSGDAAYQRIQGNNPDGTPNPAFPVLLDVDNFIDYVINGQYYAQGDWPGNYYVIRDQIAGRTEGFKFFTWDNDIPFGGGNPGSGNKVQPSPGHNWWTESPGEIDIPIRENAEYRMRFADRVYKHYHHGGAMTTDNNIARYNQLAAMIRPALFAESARWGDARGSALRTVQDHWDARIAHMVNNYFPNRQAVVFNQMRAHNLYPDLDAPEFNQHGGVVLPEFNVRFAADATVYFTTDGSDPRLPGGAINPSATSASSGTTTTTLLATGAPVRALVPADSSVDALWRDPNFDDSTWTSGTTGVGYEDSSGYEGEISLDLHGIMFNTRATAYLRIPFPGRGSGRLPGAHPAHEIRRWLCRLPQRRADRLPQSAHHRSACLGFLRRRLQFRPPGPSVRADRRHRAQGPPLSLRQPPRHSRPELRRRQFRLSHRP